MLKNGLLHSEMSKANDFTGKGCHGADQQVSKEPRKTALPCGSKSQDSGVNFPGCPGQLSCLAHILSNSGSFLVACASLNQEGFQCKGFWEVGRAGVSFLFGPLLNSAS